MICPSPANSYHCTSFVASVNFSRVVNYVKLFCTRYEGKMGEKYNLAHS